jgi:trigger factor
MQVSVEQLNSLGRKMSISLPQETFQSSYQKRVNEAAKNAFIAGFRRGKVPTKIIEQRYGAQLKDDVSRDLVREHLGKALEAQKLKIAGTPQVNVPNLAQGAFSFEVTFDVLPEIGVVDVSGLKVKREVASISEADIDQMIENLRQQRRSWEETERAAQVGDLASFEFSAQIGELRVPEQNVERGAAVLGSGNVLPEIDSALAGMSKGETKTFAVNYPAETKDERVAGKTGEATITLTQTRAPVLPAVDEEFIQSFGVPSGSLETFRSEIRGNLERELRAALSARLRAEVVDALIKAFPDFELPESLVSREAESLRAQTVENFKRQGGEVKELPPLEGFLSTARNRTRGGLLLDAIAEQNEIKLEIARVQDAISAIASTYEDPMEVVKMYQSDERMVSALRARVMEEQIAEWVAERAQTENQETSFAAIVKGSR